MTVCAEVTRAAVSLDPTFAASTFCHEGGILSDVENRRSCDQR